MVRRIDARPILTSECLYCLLGSIQTLFRIFDTYGHRLGPKAWNSCLNIVVFKMMRSDPKVFEEKAQESGDHRKQWDETITLVLGGIGTLYTNYFQIFSLQVDFEKTWKVFIEYLRSLLQWRSFEVTTNVFKELTRILVKAANSEG